MNTKEIALKVAEESGAVKYSPAPLRAVRGYSFTYEQIGEFAESLVAELAKENKPVAWMNHYKGRVVGVSFTKISDSDDKLFTIPPDKAKIEQETAEAIAAMFESQHTWLTNTAASALIRSGTWKEYK